MSCKKGQLGGKMYSIKKFNNRFKSMYNDTDLKKVEVSEQMLIKVVNISKLNLPQMLLDILSDGKAYGFEVEDEGILVQFHTVYDILDVDNIYPFFNQKMKNGIVFANDLGDLIYYYADGKNGIGIYVVGVGVADYYQDAIKLADTFENFFYKGIGVDILVKWYNNEL